ncbi:MAG: AAA family ATPase [Chloroflexi bacterium]|nr:AAA family ATPase [Chloroflexota bacterium]
MLTNIIIRNFKRLGEVEIELGSPVIFIGPNNSGKTSAMQALALWDVGLKRWNERRSRINAPESRPGVTVNRRDLVAIPVPNARLLWNDLHVRNVSRRDDGRPSTQNVRIDIVVEGITKGKAWKCGLEFDYANEESFYCRPLRLEEGRSPPRMPIPEQAGAERIAFLPPMSGLAATETRLDIGAVNVRVGEGRTAEVLRNLCFRIHEEHPEYWEKLIGQIRRLFGVDLDTPRYIAERGEIVMSYREKNVSLDLSSSGRGLQQTLLILAYMHANPNTVLLLDEPDAHLEILRQRQIYQLITEVASESGSQIIAASHSEILLNEAADKDMVIAFVGQPHRIDDRGSQVRKSLIDIGFDHYYQAEQKGWVLYLEGSTDLAILRAFARRLNDQRAIEILENPFIHYVGNQPQKARDHYFGLREALPDLKGIAIFDRIESGLLDSPPLECAEWNRREIENYFCSQTTLEAYAKASAEEDTLGPLFAPVEIGSRLEAMRESIGEVQRAMETLGRGSPWSEDAKVSDDFLTPLFRSYFQRIGLPNLMNKRDFYELAEYVPEDEIDPEIGEKMDAIVRVSEDANPIASEF